MIGDDWEIGREPEKTPLWRVSTVAITLLFTAVVTLTVLLFQEKRNDSALFVSGAVHGAVVAFQMSRDIQAGNDPCAYGEDGADCFIRILNAYVVKSEKEKTR